MRRKFSLIALLCIYRSWTQKLKSSMKLHSLPLFYILYVFLFLFLFSKSSNCQQEYTKNQQLECNSFISKGNQCNGPLKSCRSYVTFRSQPPYDNPISIAYLLGTEASYIGSSNNISSDDKIPTDKLIIVPVSCSCYGNIYQHVTHYTVKDSQNYFNIANETYQGLPICQALREQNYYESEDLTAGVELTVPMRCACPSGRQLENGVIALLAYMVTWGDNVSLIGNKFGVDEQSVLDANMLSGNDTIYPFTPLLVPVKNETCSENPGTSFCKCPSGYTTEWNSGGLDCVRVGKKFTVKQVIIGVCIGTVFLCLLPFGYKLNQFLRKRRSRIWKEKYFKQNGGFLLQQKFQAEKSTVVAKIFTAEELQEATGNFKESRILGQGGYGTVYKGMLLDGTIVAVKRSKGINQNRIEQFINEVFILSQINHRNIVKLLGCCLETEVPLLVYEFISNGTLSHHIREKDLESSLSWETRFRIACEVAGAVAYMNSAASNSIFHRDIKSSNILLDDIYSAKVSDFGTSVLVPLDKTHLTTQVQGTFGYMDPEYYQSSKFTDKSDTYSFGVTLVEILTGETPFSFAKDEGQNLVASFISLTKENKLVQILNPRVAREAEEEHIRTIAELATRCLRLNGKKRPTMKEVSTELEGLRNTQRRLEMFQEPQLLKGDITLMHSTSETMQEAILQSMDFSMEMEYETV